MISATVNRVTHLSEVLSIEWPLKESCDILSKLYETHCLSYVTWKACNLQERLKQA